MTFLKKSAVLATVAMSLAFAALGAEAKTVRVGISNDALSMDPIASSDNPSIMTQLLIYDQLVHPSKDGTKLEPGLAESWKISPDGKEYRFTLRANAKFSNGRPVTAADVVYSLKRAAGEKSQWARFFRPITNYEIVDDRTVVMKLDQPFTPMLNNLALFSAAILPGALVEEQGDKFFDKPVGAGPFVLEQWNRGAKQVFARNSNYWRQGKPAIDGAELHIIGEDNSRVLKLKAGELDAIVGVPFNQVASLKSDSGLNVGIAPVFRAELVQLNTSKKPFDDERVRRALNYAVDKNALVKGILRGNGQVATSSLPVMAYHNDGLKPYPHDVAKAKSLLQEAGYGGGLKLTLLVPSGSVTHRQVASAIQANLREAGVTVELQTIEASSMFSTTKAGNYEMALSYTTSDTIDPDQLVGFTAVNPERANAFHTQWKDARVNELYEQERRTLDGPERGKMFQEIESRVHDGAPFIFLYNQAETFASRRNVEGFQVLPTSNYSLEDVTMK
jgi:peptide/nickel transport system substrate-binding protein